ncbi:MAG: TetR/AcrR family transcriptional regulator [Deltaproteobacteria bacterium]|nr:TetR/AcrR family transcriptional regulator [Deltaproteobacteria bacterium]
MRQIAEAALVVIAESGLRRFTTKAIAEKVGIADGTIFHHFNNMEEIVLAAMDQLEDKMFAGGFPADPDPLRRLELFLCRYLPAGPGGGRPPGARPTSLTTRSPRPRGAFDLSLRANGRRRRVARSPQTYRRRLGNPGAIANHRSKIALLGRAWRIRSANSSREAAWVR